jgi:hypothetical protein
MSNTDTFLIGAYPAVKAQKAVKEERDSGGFLIVEGKKAQPAEPAKPGIRITLNKPVSFPVILKALDFWDVDIAGTVKAGEVIVRAQVVKDENYAKVEPDGTLMLSLCGMVAGVYLTPEVVEQVKKN